MLVQHRPLRQTGLGHMVTRTKEAPMPHYSEGMVLTCTHEECQCRVRIESECHCTGVTVASEYSCACGAPLLPIGSEQT